MRRSIIFLLFAVLLASIGFAQQTEEKQEKVVLKANTEFAVQLDTDLASDKNAVGDDVSFIFAEDVSGDGVQFLKGTVLLGRIVSIEKMSAKSDTAKICVMFDFVKKDSDFMSVIASITAVEPNSEGFKLTASPTFAGATTFALKGKEIQLAKGRTMRVKLVKDMTAE